MKAYEKWAADWPSKEWDSLSRSIAEQAYVAGFLNARAMASEACLYGLFDLDDDYLDDRRKYEKDKARNQALTDASERINSLGEDEGK